MTEFMVLSTSEVLLIPAIMVVIDGLDIRYLIPRSAADIEPDFYTSSFRNTLGLLRMPPPTGFMMTVPMPFLCAASIAGA